MAQQVFKDPSKLADSITKTPTLRERWNSYFDKGMGAGDNIDYWNNELIDIENSLPFETQAEHDKWTDLLSTYMGGPELPALMKRILRRQETYDFDPEQTKLLKKYKGSDYDEAMKRYLGGEGVGDILNGLVTYENY